MVCCFNPIHWAGGGRPSYIISSSGFRRLCRSWCADRLACGNFKLTIDIVKDWIEQELAHATFNIYASSIHAKVMPGMVPGTYCTMASPHFWAAMMDYSHYSRDSIFDSRIVDSVLYQASPNGDFMPLKRFDITTHGDLAHWAWVAMAAAERKFLEKEVPQIAWFQLISEPLHFLRAQWNRPENSAIGGLRYMHRWEPYNQDLLYSTYIAANGRIQDTNNDVQATSIVTSLPSWRAWLGSAELRGTKSGQSEFGPGWRQSTSSLTAMRFGTPSTAA